MGLDGSIVQQRTAFQVEATSWAKAQRCGNVVCLCNWERRPAWLEHRTPWSQAGEIKRAQNAESLLSLSSLPSLKHISTSPAGCQALRLVWEMQKYITHNSCPYRAYGPPRRNATHTAIFNEMHKSYS